MQKLIALDSKIEFSIDSGVIKYYASDWTEKCRDKVALSVLEIGDAIIVTFLDRSLRISHSE